jgi:magnesium transporter
MVEMHSNILNGMTDAFASVISNNINIVMKFLTTITILLAVPTMVSSFWGMNVHVPWLVGTNPFGFFYVVALSVTLTSAIAFILLRRDNF